jgi:hypothetical protein
VAGERGEDESEETAEAAGMVRSVELRAGGEAGGEVGKGEEVGEDKDGEEEDTDVDDEEEVEGRLDC